MSESIPKSINNCRVFIRFDPKQKERLQKEAEKREITLSELTKNALEWYLLRNPDESHK